MGKRGITYMFIGAVLLAIFQFAPLPISFELWVVCYIGSMIIAASGAMIGIVNLAKKIKADQVLKEKKQ